MIFVDKIEAIKRVRERSGCGLREAKNAVEKYQHKYETRGMSANIVSEEGIAKAAAEFTAKVARGQYLDIGDRECISVDGYGILETPTREAAKVLIENSDYDALLVDGTLYLDADAARPVSRDIADMAYFPKHGFNMNDWVGYKKTAKHLRAPLVHVVIIGEYDREEVIKRLLKNSHIVK